MPPAALLVAADGRQDLMRTGQSRQLDGVVPDCASAAGDEHPLALDAAPEVDRLVSRRCRNAWEPSDLEVQPLRQFDGPRGRCPRPRHR